MLLVGVVEVAVAPKLLQDSGRAAVAVDRDVPAACVLALVTPVQPRPQLLIVLQA